jgi:hypothetical protein
MGCLTAPLKLLLFIIFVLLLVAGWLYRDRLGDIAGAAWREAKGEAPAAAQPGAPSREGLASARRKIGTLAAGRADSVVLTADETASLLRDGLDPLAGAFFDSMQVRLLEERISVAAVIRTGRLPADVLGPFSNAVREREPVRADGSLRVTGQGEGAWDVQRMQFRDIPLPKDAIPKLLGRAMGDTIGRAIPVRLPAGVADLRVREAGLTLYRTPQ